MIWISGIADIRMDFTVLGQYQAGTPDKFEVCFLLYLSEKQ